jgi:hypothetical protein
MPEIDLEGESFGSSFSELGGAEGTAKLRTGFRIRMQIAEGTRAWTAGGSVAGGSDPIATDTESQWEDVTCWVRSAEWGVWSQNMWSGYDVMPAVIELVDNDRRFDPLDIASPYRRGGSSTINSSTVSESGGRTTTLRPGVAVEIDMDSGGGWVSQFRGFVSEWPCGLASGGRSTRTVRCFDWLGVLAASELTPGVFPGAPEETLGTRVSRWLDAVRVPAANRGFSIGSSMLLAPQEIVGNVSQGVRSALETQMANMWCDRSGVLRVGWSGGQLVGTSVNGVFTPEPAVMTVSNVVAAGKVPPLEPPVVESFQPLVEASGQRAGGSVARHVRRPDAAGGWAAKRDSRTGLLVTTDSDAAIWPSRRVRSEPSDGIAVRQVSLRPDWWSSTDRQTLLTLSQGARVLVEWRNPERTGVAARTFQRWAWVRGVKHRVDTGKGPAGWRCDVGLDDSTDLGVITSIEV